MRSLALSEISGQGSDSKSMYPLRTASNIPCWVSARADEQKNKIMPGVDHLDSLMNAQNGTKMGGWGIRTGPERRNAAQQYVEYDAGRPHVGLWSIVLAQDLRSNIVRASHDVVKDLACSKRAEIRNRRKKSGKKVAELTSGGRDCVEAN